MIKRNKLIDDIGDYINAWFQKIKRDSYISRTDRNRDSEIIAALLLNAVYNYKLKNLNSKNGNVKGIDLGDDSTSFLCVQVTSNLEIAKIEKTLKFYIDPSTNYSKVYYSGVKMFYLSVVTPNFAAKKKKEILSNYPNFSFEEDIITYEKLIKKINSIENTEQLYSIIKVLRENIHYYSPYETRTDQNQAWGQLLVNRTINRIKKFEAFYDEHISSYPKLDIMFNSSLEKLTKLDQDIETKLDILLKNLENPQPVSPSPIKALFEEFLFFEQMVLEEANRNLKRHPKELYKETGKDFQNHMRSGIEMLIDNLILNLNFIKDILGYQHEEVIINRFKQVRTIIKYESVPDRNNQLLCLLTKVSEPDPFRIDVFMLETDHIDQDQQFFHELVWTQLHLGFEEALRYIAYTNESVGLDDDFIASGGFHVASPLIFLYKLSEKQKEQLYEIQNRSNIAFYFFEAL